MPGLRLARDRPRHGQLPAAVGRGVLRILGDHLKRGHLDQLLLERAESPVPLECGPLVGPVRSPLRVPLPGRLLFVARVVLLPEVPARLLPVPLLGRPGMVLLAGARRAA
ncbi:hypothetical protein IHE61_04860 [Streptomyces sp. GKU 257-1]|nr:hypothetical protein [Streptomyces sp. GKU 257-1]